MRSSEIKPSFPWPLLALFILISAAAVTAGLSYNNYQKRHVFDVKISQLSAITDLKVRQIIQWKQERIADGAYISSDVPLKENIKIYLADEHNKALASGLQEVLKALVDSYDYANALIVDNAGRVRLFYPDADTVVGDYLGPNLEAIIDKGELALSDFHQTGKVSFVHLDMVIPLHERTTDPSAFAAIILRIDPAEILYPLLSLWPSADETGEALLFHRDGQEIVYLNQPKFAENSRLVMRRQAGDPKLAEAMALVGILQTIDAVDYRNTPVVASMRKIPETPWFLLAKLDRQEVLTQLREQTDLVLILIIFIILGVGSVFAFQWWNQQLNYYREKYETELERMAIVKHFDYILKYANDIIFLADSKLNIVEANDKAVDTYLYTRDELIGMPVASLRTRTERPRLNEDVGRIDREGTSTFETIHQRKDGTTFPIEVSARKIDIEGISYYQTISRDITERKLNEKALRESEEKFRKVFEESPFGIVITGKDLWIQATNPAFCRMTGYDSEELTGMTFKEFTHPDHVEEDELGVLKLVSGALPVYRTEKRYLRKDKRVVWASTNVCVVRNEQGDIIFFLATVEDITFRKAAELELIAAKEKAEEGDRLKTAFLHNVSHEIRTPMNAILGFSALMGESDASDEERKQYTEIIFQSGNQLLSIINDIVDLATIESGQVKFNLTRININTLLSNLCDQFRYKVREQGVELLFNSQYPDNEAELVTDKTKLQQIISNLINNSFKFTRNGTIEVGYLKMDNFFEFFVADTGIGIPEEHLSRIFDRFYQVDNKVTRKFTGTGLGLSICKAYVDLLGGSIRVSSDTGKGTEFRFTIPFSLSEPDYFS
jgi:PAS domain S-box-containing protein